jgi:hypothetical protein
MLFPRGLWAGLADGSVTLAFRRWDRPRARPGARHRTPAGVIQIDAVDILDEREISDADARRAGAADRDELLAWLGRRRDRPVHRIAFHFAGEDPRIALRQADRLPDAAWADLAAHLERLDGASRHGPWTLATLRLIRDRPEVAAADLAASLGRERPAFKADVRKLKELGLTESLRPGYRLSRRGAGLLDYLSRTGSRSPSGRDRSPARG